jgi:D-3-phosphoglycerate dehydrogenase
MPKVVYTSLNAGDGPHNEIFKTAGFDGAPVADSVNLFCEDELIAAIQGAEAVIAGSEPFTAKVIEASPALRVIARTGVGFDAVDLDACDKAGVVVTTTPGVNHHSVAELTFALLYGAARGFPESDRCVREGRWKRIARPRVMGTTIGILGLGRIGQAVCTRAVGVGMKVLAYEPYPNEEFVKEWNVDLVGLDDILARSDYITLHLPMSPETYRMMNAEAFAKMKPGAVLLNTARGQLVDEVALYDALKSGTLRAAGLDVFDVEPLPTDSPLLELDNILFSGHLAGLDNESHRDTFTMAAETTIGLCNGEWPEFCIQNLKGVTDWSWKRD